MSSEGHLREQVWGQPSKSLMCVQVSLRGWPRKGPFLSSHWLIWSLILKLRRITFKEGITCEYKKGTEGCRLEGLRFSHTWTQWGLSRDSNLDLKVQSDFLGLVQLLDMDRTCCRGLVQPNQDSSRKKMGWFFTGGSRGPAQPCTLPALHRLKALGASSV